MVGIGSLHDQDDRNLRLLCGDIADANITLSVTGVDLSSEHDESFQSLYKEPFKLECPPGSVMAGVVAKHNAEIGDSIFKVSCNRLVDMTMANLNYSSWSAVEKRAQYVCPSFSAISGIESIPLQVSEDGDQYRIDRRWRVRCSSFEIREASCAG